MTVIDHRWRQNVAKTKSSTRGAAVCHWCSYHILTSYWRDARQHGICLLIRYRRTVLHIITGTHYRTLREQTHLDQISERRTETNKVLMLIKLIVTIWSYCIWRRLFFLETLVPPYTFSESTVRLSLTLQATRQVQFQIRDRQKLPNFSETLLWIARIRCNSLALIFM